MVCKPTNKSFKPLLLITYLAVEAKRRTLNMRAS